MITVKHLETQTYVLLYMLYWQNLHILKVQLTIWRCCNVIRGGVGTDI